MVDKDKVDNWIKTKAPNLKCPCCSSQLINPTPLYSPYMLSSSFMSANIPQTPKLTLWEDLGVILRINKDKSFDYLSGMAFVVLICNDCGHVMFFDAKKLEQI